MRDRSWVAYTVVGHHCPWLGHTNMGDLKAFSASSYGTAASFRARWGGEIRPV